ncbi:MAG: sortase [Chloroflexi bacterium]|nr:sortase [Chloroflexota bacterium]
MAKQSSDEKIVPWGVVLMTIGLIVVGTAAAILFIQPTVGQTAVAQAPLPFVTVVVTAVPNATEMAASQTEPANTKITLPDNFVALEDVPRSSLANQPQRIVIPSLAVDASVVDVGLSAFESGGQTYYQWQVPEAYEAGWHNTSAPLGQLGNTVLNGHHNIFGEVFGELVDLEIGEEIVLYDYDAEESFSYTVAEVQILEERDQPLAVRLENAQWILPTNDERLTLVTCWPHSDNSHRLIVVAYPTESN